MIFIMKIPVRKHKKKKKNQIYLKYLPLFLNYLLYKHCLINCLPIKK